MTTFLTKSKWYLAVFVLCVCVAAQTSSSQSAPGKWALTWSDEFNAPDGSPVDSSKWVLETGGGGWGNNELESYTARPQNAFIQEGNLVIKVLAEKYADIIATGWKVTEADVAKDVERLLKGNFLEFLKR